MKTTNYILELVISGFGALVWILLLILCFIKLPIEALEYLISNKHSESLLVVLIIVLFPIIYTIGIVYDRFIDIYLDKWFYSKYLYEQFDSKEELEQARSIIYIQSESIKNMFEFSKLKIRILRSWIASSLMIGILLPLTLIIQFSYFNLVWSTNIIILLIFSSLFFFLNCKITFNAWKNLCRRECYLLKSQSNILSRMK